MSEAPPFLTARWVHLVMLNYQVDPALLAQRMPRGTDLDTFDGKTYVSVVGFQFRDTRVMGMSIPFHRCFEEVNLRYYVRRDTPDGERRGVVFIKEIVPRRAIAWVARCAYQENYVALPMTHYDEIGEVETAVVQYEWKAGGRTHRMGARTDGALSFPPERSEATFISEHYWGYTRQRSGSTIEYRVEHPRWRVWPCSEGYLDCDVAGIYGPAFGPYLTGTPDSMFVAEGSEVMVRRGRVLTL